MDLYLLLFSLIILDGVICRPSSPTDSWESINEDNCGKVSFNERIIGGKPADLGQYPWIARLGYSMNQNIEFKCGGSLVNKWHVITAAHCINGLEEQLRIVRLGENFLGTEIDCVSELCAPKPQDIPIDKAYKHPKYSHKEAHHDIGILRLKRDAYYNDFVRPICLPYGDILERNYVTQLVEVAGWGVTNSSTFEKADTLLTITIPIVENSYCALSMDLNVTEYQFCAGVDEGFDSCTGDSGGPMMKIEELEDSNRYCLLGLVSIGKNFCGEGPAVYTNVIKYVKWILQIVKYHHNSLELSRGLQN